MGDTLPGDPISLINMALKDSGRELEFKKNEHFQTLYRLVNNWANAHISFDYAKSNGLRKLTRKIEKIIGILMEIFPGPKNLNPPSRVFSKSKILHYVHESQIRSKEQKNRLRWRRSKIKSMLCGPLYQRKKSVFFLRAQNTS